MGPSLRGSSGIVHVCFAAAVLLAMLTFEQIPAGTKLISFRILLSPVVCNVTCCTDYVVLISHWLLYQTNNLSFVFQTVTVSAGLCLVPILLQSPAIPWDEERYGLQWVYSPIMSELPRHDWSVRVCRVWLWNTRTGPHVGTEVADCLQQVSSVCFALLHWQVV